MIGEGKSRAERMEEIHDEAAKARRAMEAMAYIQRGIENAYCDVRAAINLDERGDNNAEILEQVEHTLANVLTVIEVRETVTDVNPYILQGEELQRTEEARKRS